MLIFLIFFLIFLERSRPQFSVNYLIYLNVWSTYFKSSTFLTVMKGALTQTIFNDYRQAKCLNEGNTDKPDSDIASKNAEE